VKVNVEHGRKGEAVDLFCGQFASTTRSDHGRRSDGDISMFEHSGYSIAFNPVSEKTGPPRRHRRRAGGVPLSIVNLLPLDATLRSERRTWMGENRNER